MGKVTITVNGKEQKPITHSFDFMKSESAKFFFKAGNYCDTDDASHGDKGCLVIFSALKSQHSHHPSPSPSPSPIPSPVGPCLSCDVALASRDVVFGSNIHNKKNNLRAVDCCAACSKDAQC